MGVNQVKFGNATVMDISDSTVAPETLLSGVTAYNKAGNKIVGEVVVEHVEVEPVLETGTKSATITVGEESADIYCENTKTEVKNMKTTQSATITNKIAQFECIDKNFVKALKLAMEPIQDLHGYSNPWVGGAGKNKLNIDINSYSTSGVAIDINNGVITLSNTSTDNIQINLVTTRINVFDIGSLYKLVDDGSFTFSTNLYLNIRYYDSNGTAISNQALNSGKSMNLVIPNNATTFMPMVIIKSGVATNGTIKPMLMLQSVTDNSFEPYSNICPISGRTEASVTRTGKNVFNLERYLTDNNITYTKDGEWFIFSIYSALYANKFTLPELGYYSGQLIIDSARTVATNVNLRAYKNGSAVIQGQTFTNQQIDQVGFNYSTTGQVCCKVQAEYGASNTPYEPYTAETHTHKYPQEILGGVDDFVNGELSNEWTPLAKYNGSEAWVKASSSLYDVFYVELADEATGLVADIRSDSTDISIYSFAQMVEKAPCISIHTNLTPNRLHIAIPNATTVAECKAYLAEHNLQVCYKKATPATIQTTAEKITTLESTNVISATEPISECSYRVLEENLSDTIYSNETLVGEDSDVYTFRTAPDISDANYVEENMIGGSVAFNQLIQNGNFVNTDNWSGLRGTLSAANGILTFTYTDVSARNVVYQTIPKIKSGHKYFMSCEYRPKYNHSVQMGVELNGGSYITKTFSTIGSMWKKLTGIINGDANEQTTFSIIVRPSGGSYAANDTDQIENVIFVDLTHMFGSSVADYIYNLENTTAGTGLTFLQKYGFFTKNYYDYNAGSLQSVNFNKWFKTSKNLFNPNRMYHITNYDNIIDGNDIYIAMQKNTYACLHDVGSYIPGNGTYTLQFDPPSDITWTYASVRCRLKDNSNFGNVGTISGWTYDDAIKSYRQSFENASHVEVMATIPDCLYCEFGIGYNDSLGNIKETGTYVKFSNIQLEVGSEATDYEPYEGYEISLDTDLDLRGLFRIDDNKLITDGDIYEGDGKITRKYGVVDLGTLTWLSEDSSFLGVARVNSIQIEPLGIKWTSIPLCSLYEGVLHKGYNAFEYGEIGLSNAESAPQLRCRSEAFIGKSNEEIKAMMSGVILQYELAEPILNAETGFDSPHVFIPNGNEYFVKTYTSMPDRDFDVPAGHAGKYYGKSMFKEISLPTIPKSGGTYILKCNVLADGNKKLYWCADNN